jgi:hypothetical protein
VNDRNAGHLTIRFNLASLGPGAVSDLGQSHYFRFEPAGRHGRSIAVIAGKAYRMDGLETRVDSMMGVSPFDIIAGNIDKDHLLIRYFVLSRGRMIQVKGPHLKMEMRDSGRAVYYYHRAPEAPPVNLAAL